MVTYKFKVSFEDYDDVSRDIEIRSTQTFEDLHYAIHTAIGFDASKTATFYFSDDVWKKGKEIASSTPTEAGAEKTMLLKNAKLCDFISDPHQKLFYFFDPATPWIFHVELIKINREEDKGASYPRCIKSVGDAPKQYQSDNIATLPVPEDFDLLADDLLDEESETEETDDLVIADVDLPEGEDKGGILALDSDETTGDDFETADEDSMDDIEESDKDDF
jgi:hypothetical protein